jgi:hypothetical protein
LSESEHAIAQSLERTFPSLGAFLRVVGRLSARALSAHCFQLCGHLRDGEQALNLVSVTGIDSKHVPDGQIMFLLCVVKDYP